MSSARSIADAGLAALAATFPSAASAGAEPGSGGDAVPMLHIVAAGVISGITVGIVLATLNINGSHRH